MKQKSSLFAFTLVEVLVGITIISIIALWATRMNFNQLSHKQEVEIAIVKIVNIAEELRNNALVGKAILNGWNLEAPWGWKLHLTNGAILTSYYSILWDFSDEINLPDLNWSWSTPFSIQNIECQNINWWTLSTGLAWASIRFLWDTMELRCGNATLDTRDKILIVEYWAGAITKTVSINTLTGVIEAN